MRHPASSRTTLGPSDEREMTMGLRDRREKRHDERETFGRGGNANRYQMRQKMVSIGDDYWIENDAGDRVFRVDGKAMRLRNTLDLEDAHGTKVCRIQTRVLHIRDSMAIEDAGRRTARPRAQGARSRRSVSAGRSTARKGTTGRSRAASPTTSTRSRPTAARSPRCPRSGSGPGTPTASRSRPARTRRSSSP